jgi:hypothetical protein
VIEARSGEGSTVFEVTFPLREGNVDMARQRGADDDAHAWATNI